LKLLGMIWPPITDMKSASKACKYCYLTVWALSVLSVTNLVVSCAWITMVYRKELLFGKTMAGYAGILFFTCIGFFIKRNSRIAVFIPLAMMIIFGTGPNIIIEIVQIFKIVFMGDQFKPLYYGSWYGITSAVILFLIYLNGIRGVFAYHKLLERASYNQRINDDGRWAF